jgi:hypothetical protein
VASRFRLEAAHRDARDDQLVSRSQRGWKGGRVHIGKHPLGSVQAAHQKQPPNLEIPCMCGVDSIAVRLERRTRRVECLSRPSQVARDECYLGLGNDAPRARHGFPWSKGTRRPAQQDLCSSQIAQLRHCDPSKRERRRIVAQGHALQRAERITCRERARRCCNQ